MQRASWSALSPAYASCCSRLWGDCEGRLPRAHLHRARVGQRRRDGGAVVGGDVGQARAQLHSDRLHTGPSLLLRRGTPPPLPTRGTACARAVLPALSHRVRHQVQLERLVSQSAGGGSAGRVGRCSRVGAGPRACVPTTELVATSQHTTVPSQQPASSRRPSRDQATATTAGVWLGPLQPTPQGARSLVPVRPRLLHPHRRAFPCLGQP